MQIVQLYHIVLYRRHLIGGTAFSGRDVSTPAAVQPCMSQTCSAADILGLKGLNRSGGVGTGFVLLKQPHGGVPQEWHKYMCKAAATYMPTAQL